MYINGELSRESSLMLATDRLFFDAYNGHKDVVELCRSIY